MFLHLRIWPCLGVLLGWALLAGLAWPGATAGEPGEKPKPLTAAQQARLKEGDRLAAEARKLEQSGQLAEAVTAWQKKLAIEREVYGGAHEQVARSLAELARLHESREDFPAARKARQEVLALRTKLHGDKDWRVTDARLDLEDVDRLSKLTAEGRRRLRQATALNSQAFSLWQRVRAREALSLARQALAIRRELLGEDHPDYARSLNNLAMLYRAMGDYRQALPLYEQARGLHKRRLGEDHPAYAASLNNLALLYRAMGEYRQALPLYEQARDLHKRRLGADHPAYAASLNTLAGLYRDMGEYRQALPLFEQARDFRKRLLGADHPAYALSLSNLAALHIARSHYAQAAQPGTEALSRQRAFLDLTFGALSGRQRLDFLQQHQVYLHYYLSIAYETGIAAAESYPHVLAWKGAVAARHAEERLALDQPELQPLLEELRQRRAGLARLARLTPATKEQQADWRRRFDDLERRKEELETRLALKSDSFRQYLGLRQATAQQVADALPPQTALVDFLEYNHYGPPPEGKGKLKTEGRLLAFVLARGREPVCVQLGPTEPIEQAVRAWRLPVQSATPGRLDDKAAAALLGGVWRPLQKRLGGATAVLLAPDGALTALPFAALPGTKPGSYLLEEIAVGYVTSGRQLLELAIDPGRRADGLLAVGGLPYGPAPDAATLAALPGKAALGELPGTRLEVERLERAFRRARPGERVTLLTGAAVDAGRLQRELPAGRGRPGYRYLHLATHGFFEPPPENVVLRPLPGDPLGPEYRTFDRNPMLLSGLVLAGANRDPAKAVLTAEEVSGLDLRGAELVVLSACQTGLGKVTGTEGVLGLQRGFHEAGARALAVSLWNVSDAATSVLMEEFYHHLWEGKAPTKLEALRRAQLAVLRDPARVERRRQELRDALAKRGVAEGVLETRGLGQKAGKPEVDPDGGARRSHPA
jgi:CHAT domain-containing protein